MDMDRLTTLNPRRIIWCCEQQGISVEQLAADVAIAPTTLHKALAGEPALSVRQLRKIAAYFNRSLLFFLEPEPVNEARVHSVQFRTIANQKTQLAPKLAAFIERVEQQRQVYLSLLEDVGEELGAGWYPAGFDLRNQSIHEVAARVRSWLGLTDKTSFAGLRRAVEAKGIMVVVSNGYAGQWQIAKESPVRGFSLYFDDYPVIAIKKQASEGAQSFTLMHELGHLLLHRDSFIDDEDDFYSHRHNEVGANEFAGLVLVPDSFMAQIDMAGLPTGDVTACDAWLKVYAQRWAVSVEAILRRLHNAGKLPPNYYRGYRRWKQSVPIPEVDARGARYRHKEPARVFGEGFVSTVLEALHSKQITLARASSYLDNLKIKDLRRLKETHAHI